MPFEDLEEALAELGYRGQIDEHEFAPEGGYHFEKGFVPGQTTLAALAEFIEERVPKKFNMALVKRLDMVGKEAVKIAQRMIDEGFHGHNRWPAWLPLSPSTIEEKGFDQILYLTGQLRDSIRYEVNESILEVRLFSDVPWIEYSELGTATEPARPLLQPAMDQALAILPEQLRQAVNISFDPGSPIEREEP